MLAGAPRLSGDDDANALVEILRIQPASVGYRARLAMDGQFFAPMPVFASALSAHSRATRSSFALGWTRRSGPGCSAQERFFEHHSRPTAQSTSAARSCSRAGGGARARR